METAQPLTTESFSYSWLTNKRPCFDGSSDEEEEEETKFLVKSRRFMQEDNFHFDVPISDSSSHALIHADEIFLDGHILPLYFDTTTSAPTTPVPSFSSKTVYFTPKRRKYCHFLEKWKISSKRVLLKCFRFLVPRKSIKVDDIVRKVWEVKSLSNSVQSSPQRNTARSTSGDWLHHINKSVGMSRAQRKAKSWNNSPAKSWNNSPLESPLRVPSYSYCSKDAIGDTESSVYEAVLHCKRSFEK